MSLLSILDLDVKGFNEILDLTKRIKSNPGEYKTALSGRKLAMLFEKPSTRTRVSFEAGMLDLGGKPLVLSASELQLGRGESVADTARVLGRYVDCIMARVKKHESLQELDKFSGVPVINGLSDREHPCQALGDLFTVREVKGRLSGLKMAYVGDANNVCNSLMLACALAGVNITLGCPKELAPDKFYVDSAGRLGGRRSFVEFVDDPVKAVSGADVVYTDVWVSMGDEAEADSRRKLLRGYQVNPSLMRHAKKDAVFMHCLPAHRGEEVVDEVIDSKQSVVWQEAENRMHVQKAILVREMSR